MRSRPRHAKKYDQSKDVPEDVLQNGMQFGCANVMCCGCQTCLRGGHSDGKSIVHCNAHDQDCHLQCS